MATMGASLATSTSVKSDFIWLINTVYWKSNEKPDTCKGYSAIYCKDCEHHEFCSGREEILAKLSALRQKELREGIEEHLKSEEPPAVLTEEPTKV